MNEHGGNGGSDPSDLTVAVRTARRGFRRDVELLVKLLDRGRVFIPLAKSIAGVTAGEEVEATESMEIAPHMLVDDEGNVYATLFTRTELLEPFAEELEWTTDDGPLEFAAIPARAALEMAVGVVDEESVVALVINPMHESELMLRRDELQNIAAGKAIPLVGYVSDLPEQDFEETLVAERDMPKALSDAVAGCLADMVGVLGYELSFTFNAERDVEPHPTLKVRTVRPAEELSQLAQHIVESVKDHVPDPGYIDVLFEQSDEE
ncbi:MAG: SseB family protein [Polyangiaceae bacterium]